MSKTGKRIDELERAVIDAAIAWRELEFVGGETEDRLLQRLKEAVTALEDALDEVSTT